MLEHVDAGRAVSVQLGPGPALQAEVGHLQHLPSQAHSQHSRTEPSEPMLPDDAGSRRASPHVRFEQDGRQVQAPAPRPGGVVVDDRDQAPVCEPEVGRPEVAVHQVIGGQAEPVETLYGLTHTMRHPCRGTVGRFKAPTLVRIAEDHVYGVLRPGVAAAGGDPCLTVVDLQDLARDLSRIQPRSSACNELLQVPGETCGDSTAQPGRGWPALPPCRSDERFGDLDSTCPPLASELQHGPAAGRVRYQPGTLLDTTTKPADGSPGASGVPERPQHGGCRHDSNSSADISAARAVERYPGGRPGRYT